MHDRDSWTEVERLNDAIRSTLVRIEREDAPSSATLEARLRSAIHRPAALLVLLLCDDEMRRRHFSTLVWLASWPHGLVRLVQAVILLIEPDWLQGHIEAELVRQLDLPSVTAEEYYALADLLERAAPRHLGAMIQRARASRNPELLEFAQTYERYIDHTTPAQ